MGNSSSRDGCYTSNSPTITPRGGQLDPKNQLEEVYKRMIEQNEHVKQQFQKTFQSVRILVVGRSGSGKTTLIRLLIGDNGPRTISLGAVGVQDIMTEWRHPDPELPLIIHDSNGIDSAGQARFTDIRKFLDRRLASDAKFEDRVHAVWYVFSAIDVRLLDDGGLLEMLDRYGKDLPLLLVMTFNDIPKKLDEDLLGLLLGKIKDETKRQKLKETMVKLGNDIKYDRVSNKIVKEVSIKDLAGLERLFEGTKQLMKKELWITWASCQALNMNSKLEASAKLIVRIHKHQIFASSTVVMLPVVQQIQLAAMFGSVTTNLVKIWNAPKDLEKAIAYKFLAEERWHALTRDLAKNIIEAFALAGALTLTVVTVGISVPMVATVGVSAPTVATVMAAVRNTSTLLMSYALMMLGAIIYVRTHEQTTGAEQTSVEEYLKLCDEFMASDWSNKLSKFSEGYTSMWETSFREKRQTERLKSQIVNFFEGIDMRRPNSLFTILNRPNAGVAASADILQVDADVHAYIEDQEEFGG